VVEILTLLPANALFPWEYISQASGQRERWRSAALEIMVAGVGRAIIDMPLAGEFAVC